MKITRRALYVKIWSMPIERIAAQLGTSATSIHSACKQYQIPKPGRGHWRRLETGQSIPPAPLPNAGNDCEILLSSTEKPAAARKSRRVDRAPSNEAAAVRSLPTIALDDAKVVGIIGPDPIALLKRLPDWTSRETFLSALESEADTRAPETAAAARAWANRAKGAAVILEMIEAVMAACSESSAANTRPVHRD